MTANRAGSKQGCVHGAQAGEVTAEPTGRVGVQERFAHPDDRVGDHLGIRRWLVPPVHLGLDGLVDQGNDTGFDDAVGGGEDPPSRVALVCEEAAKRRRIGECPQLALEHIDKPLGAGPCTRVGDGAKQGHDEPHHDSPDHVVAGAVPPMDGGAGEAEFSADGLDVDPLPGQEILGHGIEQLLLGRRCRTAPGPLDATTRHIANAKGGTVRSTKASCTRRAHFVGAGLAAIGAAVLLGLVCAPAGATVWLCKPGKKPDPCTPGLSTTVYNAPLTKAIGVRHPKAERNPPIDCFYVYPTVSDEKTANSNLVIQDTERSIALYQVSRYSQYCRIYAPMYRQVTLSGAGLPGAPPSATKPNPLLGVKDVENALADYLKHDNHGRGFVLIGHSQGAGVLETVIAKKIDTKPAVRKRLLSAILMGGNVLVKGRTGIGGDFKHIPACRSATQLGCVIAFSTFDQPVPKDSLFGRPGALKGLGMKPPKGDEVLCTNPASLAGRSGLLDPIQPSAPFAPGSTIALGLSVLKWNVPKPPTVYWSSPRSFTARCEDSNGAHVLEVAAHNGAQTPTPAPTPEWGLHLLDANLSLGNLIGIVHSEAAAYQAHRRK